MIFYRDFKLNLTFFEQYIFFYDLLYLYLYRVFWEAIQSLIKGTNNFNEYPISGDYVSDPLILKFYDIVDVRLRKKCKNDWGSFLQKSHI